MHSSHSSAPPPDLRIIPIESALPHEEHDSQRSEPLIERIRHARHMINPPVVAPMDGERFVILDGANRCYVLQRLEFSHLLVQVAPYDGGYVELETWQHIVSNWQIETFIEHLKKLDDVHMIDGQDNAAVAHILFRDGRLIALRSPVETTHERNAVLRKVVRVYQQNATLNRTAISEPEEIWPLYPHALALVIFPRYTPQDIIAAAKYQAYLPPGISRHIIHGRALRVNYLLASLRDDSTSLADKNEALKAWIQDKLANRKVRYYAEATYQFDE